MSNYLITGIAGTGKSAVGETLARHGYDVIETDRVDSNQVVYRHRIDVRTQEPSEFQRGEGWDALRYVRWRVSADTLRNAIQDTNGRVRFVCGYANNWDELAGDFDAIFLLEAKPETIKDRLLNRVTGDWGKKYPEELKHALETATEYNESIRKLGAIAIDADKSLDYVVTTILNAINQNQ